MRSVPSLNPDGEFEPAPQPESMPDLKIVGGIAHPGDGAAEPGSSTTLPIGAKHHRSFVGAAEGYDVMAAAQFSLLTLLGLRQNHYLVDVGCGSLRVGRLLLAYLQPDRYYGIEPEQWLIDEGIACEVGQDLIDLKRPMFNNSGDFNLAAFNQQFDFVLAQSVFSHASLSQVERCLTEAKQVMAPEALFAATFVRSEEDYGGESWVYPGCVSYSLATIRKLAAAVGLVCQPIEWHHSAQQIWVVFTHPENAERLPVLDDAARMLSQENDLRLAKQRLAKLERHPYVKLGMKVVGHPVYVKLREATSRLRRAA